MEAIPKYKEIMDYIKEQIQNNVYEENSKLPTEESLALQFNTSRPTVVKAMDRLRDQGIVYRVQGSGTFVNKSYTAATSNSSNIISVVLPFAQYRDTTRLDELNIIKGIEKQLSQHGFFTMIHYCKDEGMDFIETMKSVKKSLSAGIIAYVAKDLMSCNEIYELFMDEYPIVLIDQPIIGINLPCVRADNIRGSGLATKHLIDCGYDVIYFLSDVNLNYNESIRERYIGYCQIVQNYKDAVSFNHILFSTQSEAEENEQVHAIAKQLVEKHKGKRIGLFCTSDFFASKVYNAFVSLGCNIPQDIGIVGFDGLDIVLQGNKRLTTVAQDYYNIGRLASNIMLKWIGSKELPASTIKSDVKLIIGDTASAKE